MTGGRDHLSHRLLRVLHGPRGVAVALALLQGALSTVAILGYELGTAALASIAFGVFLTALAAIALLDTARWRPADIPIADQLPYPQGTAVETVGID